MKLKKVTLFVVLSLISLVLFSGCGTNNREVTAYLKAVGPDFEKTKEDLKFFNEEYNVDSEGLTKALETVKKGKTDFEAGLENVNKQKAPAKPEGLAAFHTSLTGYYTDAIKLLGDYELILNYSVQLLDSVTPIEKAASTDLGKAPSMEEVKIMVKGLKTSIDESILSAQKCTPPQYMTDSHANYVEVLKKFGTSTDDFIYALQISDPLRIYAANYRYELLSNKLDRVSDEMDKNIEEQQTQMDEMGKKLEKTQDDLYKQLLLWQGQYKIEN